MFCLISKIKECLYGGGPQKSFSSVTYSFISALPNVILCQPPFIVNSNPLCDT